MSDLSTAQQLSQARVVRSPRGSRLSCKNWLIEAACRMLQSNHDPEVAGNPDARVVYGGIGKAARSRVGSATAAQGPRTRGESRHRNLSRASRRRHHTHQHGLRCQAAAGVALRDLAARCSKTQGSRRDRGRRGSSPPDEDA